MPVSLCLLTLHLVTLDPVTLDPGKVAVAVRKSLEKHDPAVIGPLPTSGQGLARPPVLPPGVLAGQARPAVREEVAASRPGRNGAARATAAVGRGR